MFDDGYDYFCLNFVSMFEQAPSTTKSDKGTYCGCVDHLEQLATPTALDDRDDAQINQ